MSNSLSPSISPLTILSSVDEKKSTNINDDTTINTRSMLNLWADKINSVEDTTIDVKRVIDNDIKEINVKCNTDNDVKCNTDNDVKFISDDKIEINKDTKEGINNGGETSDRNKKNKRKKCRRNKKFNDVKMDKSDVDVKNDCKDNKCTRKSDEKQTKKKYKEDTMYELDAPKIIYPVWPCNYHMCKDSITESKRCERCKTKAYCSKKCQKLDWQYHKHECINDDKTETKSQWMDSIKKYIARIRNEPSLYTPLWKDAYDMYIKNNKRGLLHTEIECKMVTNMIEKQMNLEINDVTALAFAFHDSSKKYLQRPIFRNVVDMINKYDPAKEFVLLVSKNGVCYSTETVKVS